MADRTVADLLPAAREGASRYRIAVVCLGNICRSPIGEVVLTAKLAESGLGDRVEVVSAGTGTWHLGEEIDRRAAAVLAAHGYDPSQHRAKQFGPEWFVDYDLVLAMDERNHQDISRMSPGSTGSRLRMFREFDPHATDGDRDVPDPWYGEDDGFDTVLAMVERTAGAIVEALRAELART